MVKISRLETRATENMYIGIRFILYSTFLKIFFPTSIKETTDRIVRSGTLMNRIQSFRETFRGLYIPPPAQRDKSY